MLWYEILIVAGAALFVIGILALSLTAKKRGKSGCGCGTCAGCGEHCSHCKGEEKSPHTGENSEKKSR